MPDLFMRVEVEVAMEITEEQAERSLADMQELKEKLYEEFLDGNATVVSIDVDEYWIEE